MWLHSKVVIIPKNQDKYKNDARFKDHKLPDGRIFATIGAGPDGPGQKFLVSSPNRPNDVAFTEKNADAWYQVLRSPSGNEDDDIEALFAADASYGDDLDYAGVPFWDDEYNSNGFAHGLLLAVGYTGFQKPPWTPGWDHVVPFPKAPERKGSVKIECSPENPNCMK